MKWKQDVPAWLAGHPTVDTVFVAQPTRDAGVSPTAPADPAVAAAEQLRSPRIETIALSRFFCDARRCYPVVGGVQVYGDVTRLMSAFARTLRPFLLDDVRRLAASWP